MLLIRPQVKRISRFILAGALSTGVNYFVFFILSQRLRINYILASSTGYITGLILGFVINHFWTFSADQVRSKRTAGYFAVYLSSLVVSNCLLWLLVKIVKFPAMPSNLICIGTSTLINFLSLNYFIYTDDGQRRIL